MRDLVDFLVSELVDDPDSVEVTESEDDRGYRYTVHVAPDDMGKVIGKGGRTAKAIRAVVREQGCAVDEAIGIVGTDLHGHLASDAVGLRDVTDDDGRLTHVSRRCRRRRWRRVARRRPARRP